MLKALNEQVNKEMYSAYLYLSMSAHCTNVGLNGFANWFMVQYQEETFHAMKIYNYINEQGEKVVLQAIEKPPSDFGTPLEMFQATLKHEQFITKSIHDLVTLALEEKDYATQIFLQWFITEQIEEESNDNEIISKLKLIGDNTSSLFVLDKELSVRVFTPPAVE
ncbi:MAG: ferritin [Methanomethylovorans sp.]|uniref:ferritin n=1 Tax=Methanomethylovorans sp. TaxID=2758717 RepID=UPI00353156ED